MVLLRWQRGIGTASNMLEGIPLTSSVTGLCASRPACTLVMLVVLLGLLLWRVPNAVRLSQGCAVVVTALMCVCSAAVLANVVSPSEGAEGTATYLGVGVSILNGLLGLAELAGLCLAVVPSTVSALQLQGRTLGSVILRVFKRKERDDGDQAVPMLQVPSVSSMPNAQCQSARSFTPTEVDSKSTSVGAQPQPAFDHTVGVVPNLSSREDDDNAWVDMVVSKVRSQEGDLSTM